MLRWSAVVASVVLMLAPIPARTATEAKRGGASAPPAKSGAAPLDVTREFYKALHAGNARAAAKLAASQDAEPALRSFVAISGAYRDLEAALAKRFGAEAAERVGYGRKVQSEIKALLGATAEVEGASARISALDGHTITTLRKVGGAWRVELEDALETPEGRSGFAAQARASGEAAKAVVPRVAAGEYDSPEEAIQDFEARIASAAGERRGVRPEAGPKVPEDGGAQL